MTHLEGDTAALGPRGLLVVVAGPSGVGKGTVIRRLIERRPLATVSVSATTRAPRPGEVDAVHYHFVDHDGFAGMVERDAFLEHARYAGQWYGTPEEPVRADLARGRDVLLDIEVQGALQIRDRAADAVLVFLEPPSDAELERRLRARGTEDEERIRVRLRTAEIERASADRFDLVLVNDDLEDCVGALDAYLTAERVRRG